jgi:hypothetical protein
MLHEGDLMTAAEVKALFQIKADRTLYRYRKKHWVKNIHWIAPVQRILYVRPMIMDWVFNHKDNPLGHQDAMEAWVDSNAGPPKTGKNRGQSKQKG